MLAEVPSFTSPPQPKQGQPFSDIKSRADKHGCDGISRVLSAVWPAASAAWRVRRGALVCGLPHGPCVSWCSGVDLRGGFVPPPVERSRVSETHGPVLRSFDPKAPAKCRARAWRALRESHAICRPEAHDVAKVAGPCVPTPRSRRKMEAAHSASCHRSTVYAGSRHGTYRNAGAAPTGPLIFATPNAPTAPGTQVKT